MLTDQQVETFIYGLRTQVENLQAQQKTQNGQLNDIQTVLNSLKDSQSIAVNQIVTNQTDTYFVAGTILHKLKTTFNSLVTFITGLTVSAGSVTLSALTASRPLKLDSSRIITSAKIDLSSPSTDIQNILTVPNGGTALATLTTHAVVLGNAASAPHFAAPSTSGFYLKDNGAAADPTFSALPSTYGGPTSQIDVTSTRVLGTVYHNTLLVPVWVSVWASKTTGGQLVGISDSNAAPTVVVASITVQAVVSDDAFITFIVLPGNYYKATLASGTLDGWIETQ